MTPRLVLVLLAKLNLPVVLPATPRVRPPAPCTAKVVLTVVAPLRLTAPVPVAKVPVPVCRKIPVSVMPPLVVNKPVSVVAPVTAKLPPSVVAPELTLNVLVPVTAVEPFKLTAPVPVPKVPVPVWLKLPLVCE